jgi:hypothetical protein
MKLPISYFFLPAQELTVRVAAAAQKMTLRQKPPGGDDDGGQESEPGAIRNKQRGRAKYRRLMLEMEPA